MLTREQLARRACKELKGGDRVYFGVGLVEQCRECAPAGIEIVTGAAAEHPADVALVFALQVSEHGELSAEPLAAQWQAQRVVVVTDHVNEDGSPRIVAAVNAVPGSQIAHRIITPLAVIDVTPEGLILRELASGLSAADVQAKTEAALLADANLSVIDA